MGVGHFYGFTYHKCNITDNRKNEQTTLICTNIVETHNIEGGKASIFQHKKCLLFDCICMKLKNIEKCGSDTVAHSCNPRALGG